MPWTSGSHFRCHGIKGRSWFSSNRADGRWSQYRSRSIQERLSKILVISTKFLYRSRQVCCRIRRDGQPCHHRGLWGKYCWPVNFGRVLRRPDRTSKSEWNVQRLCKHSVSKIDRHEGWGEGETSQRSLVQKWALARSLKWSNYPHPTIRKCH